MLKIVVCIEIQVEFLYFQLVDYKQFTQRKHYCMEIEVLKNLLQATVICGSDRLNESATAAFASDLMSDVLTLDTDKILLITGLCNTQTIRTAEMADISFIVFVRGKRITPEMQAMACENNMVLLECSYSMFKTAGILYSNGLKPIY